MTIPSDHRTETDAVAELLFAGQAPQKLDPETVYLLRDASGEHVVFDTDEYGDGPRRVRRDVQVDDLASFTDYVNRWNGGDGAEEVWADEPNGRIVGILDPPPGWACHRVTYGLKLTPEWKAWSTLSGVLLEQAAFAEFLEDHLAEIVVPSGAVMLELAQSFEATTQSTFESAQRLSDGRRALEFREEVQARAGRGTIEIPATFELGIAPWLGSDPFKVTARLRYRINSGTLSIGFKLVDPAAVLRAAFADIVKVLNESPAGQVLVGRPGDPLT